MAGPQKQTFTNVTPIAPQQTFTDVTPIDSGDQRGLLARTWDTIKTDAGNLVDHPGEAAIGAVKQIPTLIQSGLPRAATLAPVTKEEFPGLPAVQSKAGWLSDAFNKASDAVSRFTSPQTQGEQAGADAITAGSIAASVPSAVKLGASALGEMSPTVGRVLKTAGKVAQGTIEDTPIIRQAGKISKYWNETAPAAAKPGPEFGPSRTMPGQVAPEVIQPAPRSTAAPVPARQGLALPAAPAGAELGDLWTPAAKPAAQTGEALATVKTPQPGQAGQLAASMQQAPAAATPSAEVAPGFQRGKLQDLLDRSVGAKRLEPNVPLRKQMGATSARPAATADAAIPEGHTALDSSALRSYKYDPATNEFEAWPTSGPTAYRFGDVSPDVAQAFEQAESKGKAFQAIKNSGTLVAKRINGKWVPVKPANP